jgi:hypothetical protein
LERTFAVCGDLTVGWWTWEPAIMRLTAKILDNASAALLPPLTDVALVTVNKRHIVLRGVETVSSMR